ncbi:MAG: IclR family transcriptional regulator [Caulobacterales bacterium]|nr:IclR family transcriptional regulator [Caulobacterales bacterium]
MKDADIAEDPKTAAEPPAQPSGSQTLVRGLDVIEAVADGPIALGDLAARLGLNRSTTHRLANALVERRYLTFRPRSGYRLGPKIIQLGFIAQSDVDVVRAARPHIEDLAAATEDTVHLGVPDEGRALYLDKIPGKRRVEISSRIGDRHPLTSTGLGKALLLDGEPTLWSSLFGSEDPLGRHTVSYSVWLERMQAYAAKGYAFDLEENEDRIRCVAAPIRDAAGEIVAAISVSSAAQYMADERMAALSVEVVATANAISEELGWDPNEPRAPRKHRVRR